MVIYIDHSVTVFIAKQTKLTTNNTNKFNFRFVRVFIYFSQFELDVKHKPSKLYIIPNVLSRFFKKIRYRRYRKYFRRLQFFFFPIVENEFTLVKMADKFKTRLKQIYKIINNGTGFVISSTHKTRKIIHQLPKNYVFNT